MIEIAFMYASKERDDDDDNDDACKICVLICESISIAREVPYAIERFIIKSIILFVIIIIKSIIKEREDLEQELVRNHRHCRLIDQRSNHRHRQHRLLDP